MTLTSLVLLLLLLASGCAAKSCQRADVDRSSSGSWSFDLDGCTLLKLRGTKIGDAGAKALAEALNGDDGGHVRQGSRRAQRMQPMYLYLQVK